MKTKIEEMIKQALTEINEELNSEELKSITKDTKLYGGNSALDSLGLVNLITDLEEMISDEFDIDIVLADEKAMSQRTSPFRTVETLTDYIAMVVEQ